MQTPAVSIPRASMPGAPRKPLSVSAKNAVLSACEVTELENTREMYFQKTLAAATQDEKVATAAEGAAAMAAIEKRYLAHRQVSRLGRCGTFDTRLARTVGEIGFATAL